MDDVRKLIERKVTNSISAWRKNTLLSQKEVASRLDVPLRTWESWEMGDRSPAPWARVLILKELIVMAAEEIEERERKVLEKLKSDEEGRRPVGSWAVLQHRGEDVWVFVKASMIEALVFAEKGDEVAYIACNQTEDGPKAWYEDRNGTVESDYYNIVWERSVDND